MGLSLPGPRIVFLEARILKRFYCRRVYDGGTVKHYGDFVRDLYVTFEDEPHGTECGRVSEGFEPRWALFGLGSQSSIPLLYVCRESYEVASTYYERAFGSYNSFPQTWFDFKSDTLYLDFMRPDGGVFSPDFINDDIKGSRGLRFLFIPKLKPYLYHRKAYRNGCISYYVALEMLKNSTLW